MVLRIFYRCTYDSLGQRVAKSHHQPPPPTLSRAGTLKPSTAHAPGQVGVPARCCLSVSMRMLNPGGRTTASATTVPPWVPITPKTHSDSPHAWPRPRSMSTTQHTGSMFSGCMAEVMLRKRKSSRKYCKGSRSPSNCALYGSSRAKLCHASRH